MSSRPADSPLLHLLRRFLSSLFILAISASFLFAQAVTAPPAPIAPSVSPAPPSVDDKFLASQGMRYWLVVKTEPRPLRIHHVRIDLATKSIQLKAVLADDPDADGPANAKLTPPMALAERSRAILFVNANPWQGLVGPDGKRVTDWRENLPVQILGLAVSGGLLRSASSVGHCPFWLDRADKPHIGEPADVKDVRESVAGFLRLLTDGVALRAPDEKIHPRTALGLDSGAHFLTLVVVDGRQPGYSEGMNYAELADYMKSLGCLDAVNLDGGGSSIMILSDSKGSRRILNDPSTKDPVGVSLPRPIPVALVVSPKP